MTPKGFLPKQTRAKLAFVPEVIPIASGYRIEVSVKTGGYEKASTIVEHSVVVVKIGGTKSHQSIPMQHLHAALSRVFSLRESWLDGRSCWEFESPVWTHRMLLILERIAHETNIRGASLVRDASYVRIAKGSSESQAHVKLLRDRARFVNTGSKPSRTRRIDGMPTREEIDRAEAESCGIVPLKRGLESDDAYQRRSERHERDRYRRSNFDD